MNTITKLTKITTQQSKAKKFVKVGNRLVKDERNTGVITKAKAETIQVNNLYDLKDIINNASPNEMLILGHNKHASNFNMVTRHHESVKHNAYARTLDNFVYGDHAIVLMDFDNLEDEGMTIDQALQSFADYYPSFAKAAKLICKSSTGAIKELNKQKYHIFVILKDAKLAQRVFKQWETARNEKELPVILDQALFSSQQNRIVFLKPEVPSDYTVDKECTIIEGELFWDPSSEIIEDILPEYSCNSVTVIPTIKEEDLRNNNHKLMIERFNKATTFDEMMDMLIQLGCRPSKKRGELFTPQQTGSSPKLKIISKGTHFFASAIGKMLHGKRGYNAFPLLMKTIELQGKTKTEAYIDAIRVVFGKIGGNDPLENAEAFKKELVGLPKVVDHSDAKFKPICGFEEAQKSIQKTISTFVKSVHGSGKTDHIVKSVLVDMVKSSGKKMVYLAPTISLCEQAAFEVSKTGVDVQVYSNFDHRKEKYIGAQIVISTPNSFIENVIKEGFIPDIVVVDEWVRVAASLCQRDNDDPFMGLSARKAIIDRLKATEHLVLLDADDSYVSTELSNYLGVKSFMNNSHKEYEQPSYVIRDCKNLSQLFDLAISYENAFIFTDSKKATKELSVGLSSKGFKVLTVNSETTGNSNVVDFLADPNKEVFNYDYVIFSPSMNVGTSVTSVEWPTIGLIKGVVSPYDVLQGLRRSRRIGVVKGEKQPIHVFFNETRYNKDSVSGAITQKTVDAYNKKLDMMSRTLFKSSDESVDVLLHLEEFSSIFNIVYNQKPSQAFADLLKYRRESFTEIASEDEPKESVSGLTKSVVKELSIEAMAKELSEARPAWPSHVYHNFSARKAFEKETGVPIVVDEKFSAERNRDAMEIMLNISEEYLDSEENCKRAIKENWMTKAIAYKTLTDSHSELFQLLMELGSGSLKSGDFAKQSIQLLREYCWVENGVFKEIPITKRMEIRRIISGNYLTAFGYEFGIRAGKENINDFDKASGRVIRRFLGNFGMVVDTKRRSVDGSKDDYSVLTTQHYIIAKPLDDDSVMAQEPSEQVKLASEIFKRIELAREIAQHMKIDE